ncbi:hypothetical protein ABT269_39745 [Streptomyces viridosporus]|uniref:hypothetical protein n=1 Tax=Streptomyces viridosporus TaxID=67581 RepID=UPI00331F7658
MDRRGGAGASSAGETGIARPGFDLARVTVQEVTHHGREETLRRWLHLGTGARSLAIITTGPGGLREHTPGEIADQLLHNPTTDDARLTQRLADRGHILAAAPPARSARPHPPWRRHAWATTAALVELWRTRHAITAVPGPGPRPADPGDAAAWGDLAARICALTGRRRPAPHLPPPDAPASTVIEAALGHLDTPPLTAPLPAPPPCATPAASPPSPTARSTRAWPGVPWPPNSPAKACPKPGWRRSPPLARTTRTNSAPTPSC